MMEEGNLAQGCLVDQLCLSCISASESQSPSPLLTDFILLYVLSSY